MGMFDVLRPSPLRELDDPNFSSRDIRLIVKRDDLYGWDSLAGNKCRKLRLNLVEAEARGETTLLTFGGPYSNHLRAVAEAGRRFGFRTIGIVRGDEERELNWSLRSAVEDGMSLVQVDRATYRRKKEEDYIRRLRSEFGGFYLVPEGGSNEFGVRGCADIAREISVEFDVVCCACGTGGTLAGLSFPLASHQRAIGVSAFPSADFLRDAVADFQRTTFGAVVRNWEVIAAPELGRFARVTEYLKEFGDEFADRHGFVLEKTYVLRMMYGLSRAVKEGGIREGSTVVAVVTGPADDRDLDR